MSSPTHLPRIRQVDEGDWRAMPHITAVIAIVSTAVSILMWWGVWELLCWLWRAIAS